MSRDVPWCHCKVEQEVLDSDRVQTVVQQLATSGSSLNDDNQKRKLCIEQQRAVKILKTMASSISGLVVRLTGLVLFKVFGSATSGIRVHQGQMEMVKQAAKVCSAYTDRQIDSQTDYN
jgi:glycerol-3-phosphate O-acyltransferase